MSHLKQMDVGTVALTSPKVTGDFTVDTNSLHVDSTNNRVGVGTSSPSATLDVEGSSNSTYLIVGGDDSSNGRALKFTSSASASFNGAVHTINAPSSQGVIALSTSSAERMRIDSSGNLLVGHTGSIFNNINATSTVGTSYSANGEIFACSSESSGVMFLNRKSSDGAIATFRKDGTDVGKIGTKNGYIFIGSNSVQETYIGLNNNYVYPGNADGTFKDNAIDLGNASARYDDVFATNTSITTSDQNEKQDIASLTSAEITAAKAISKLFKTFKWKDKVASKGDSARTHAGVIAQEVQSAMSDAGLDATKYAFWCSDTWWEKDVEVPAVEADEENGIEAKDAYTRTDTYETADAAPEGATERTRLGVRYPELLAFVGAATEQRLADIETRLTALEG
jgi:hypothetical protein